MADHAFGYASDKGSDHNVVVMADQVDGMCDGGSGKVCPQQKLADALTEPFALVFACSYPGCGRELKHATALRLHEQLHVDYEVDTGSGCGDAMMFSTEPGLGIIETAPSDAACTIRG